MFIVFMKYNVLYLNSHDTGRCISPYGYPVQTPSLQALAESGTVFRHAHCVAPTCSPSRAGLLTGQSAHGAGMVGLSHRGGVLRHPERHLAHVLSSKGYETVRAGLTHVGNPNDHGYTLQSNADIGDSEAITDFAESYVRAAPRDHPFYLDVGYYETHRVHPHMGFSKPSQDMQDKQKHARYVQAPPGTPDNKETRQDWWDFLHSVERLDRYYGRILVALEQAGLAENTIVLATTDHGPAFPGMKCSLTSRGTGVFLIIRFPGGQGAGQVVDTPVSHLDWYPTLCDLLNVPKPDWLEGQSLLPLLEKRDYESSPLFAEVTFHAAFEPKRSVRTQRWLYIYNFASPYSVVLANCDESASKRVWMDHGAIGNELPEEELYDVLNDPDERVNLANDPAYASNKRIMQDLLYRWMKRTDDPLLTRDFSRLVPHHVNPWTESNPSRSTEPWNPSEWQNLIRSLPHPETP